MKKFIKLSILLLVCMLPFMVNAETKLNFEWKLENQYFVVDSNGQYYFFNNDDYKKVDYYDKNGNKLGTKDFIYYDHTIEEIYNDPVGRSYFNYYEVDLKYNAKNDVYFYVDYFDDELVIYDKDDNETVLSFTDDVEQVKDYLGIEYNIYKSIVDDNYDVFSIIVEDGYYIVFYDNGADEGYYRVYDKNAKLILHKELNSEYYTVVRIDKDKIYVIEEQFTINVYNLKAELIGSYNLKNSVQGLYENHDFSLYDFNVTNNNVMLFYNHYYAEQPKGLTSVKDFYIRDANKDLARTIESNYLFLKYRLDGDMTLATSKTGGNYTAEKKIDEYDREYVELKITTTEGYVVDKITVTDINGNEIPVVDNKFYTPGTDVSVAVSYKVGEYLPIPDTSLSKSVTVVIIGLILIGLGLYTFNYVNVEEK